MEKLQAAIERAREQRQSREAGPRRDGTTASAGPVGTAPVAVGTNERWEGLVPVEVPPRAIRKNRLVSSVGGKEAGPFDLLRTRILQQAQANGWKRVALVSSDSASGKSTVAANLAFSFGRQADKRTMVLDFDLRRHGLAKILGQRCSRTMADVLQGKTRFAELGVRLGNNVALGLNGVSVRNASEILQSQQTKEKLHEIETDYNPDILLFDMPPLMATDDNFGFLKNVDCAILIAEAERSTIEQVDLAERQLAELTSVMGIVLNKSLYSGGVYGYGYGYG